MAGIEGVAEDAILETGGWITPLRSELETR